MLTHYDTFVVSTPSVLTTEKEAKIVTLHASNSLSYLATPHISMMIITFYMLKTLYTGMLTTASSSFYA